ncbi:cytochrome c oxidase accessory protein CcoG [Halomonas caseinilytica]|uniref:cytochrome c oxidase accessory protein CcoG n=1 Tax=Halomonas caseinilytica TaxID=438744 RepID=UPI0007E56014|nr:cytochrome c oxidase accessory protein CcoG [Halomonas caseinilytica]SEM09206.1 cytochrome c oxidase accessory protein FixG [Halomonas caseinilytica]
MTQDIAYREADDRIPVTELGHSLYEPRRHIQVREVRGRFQRWRRGLDTLLVSAFFALPWVSLDGRPAIWFDLPGRAFHLFTMTFYPQEFMLLSWLLIIAAFALFFVTVLAGRLWCGYACPQSVWTWWFIWVEHRLEGPRHRRLKRDRRPLDVDTACRKGLKHALWLAIALATGLTFIGYFTPIRDLVMALPYLEASGWAYFWLALIASFTYLNAGWLREQVCLHMCPYARFQAVMFDRDTLTVSYDAGRGEPRAPRRRETGTQATEPGDCVDCGLCVQVCPTGIDIREGLQHACIDCAACIDACDGVMDRLGRPRGLIRYTTENALAGKPTRMGRPRLLGYLVALLAMLALFAGNLADRTPLDLDVERDRQHLFRMTSQGNIANVYTLTVRNLDNVDHRYRLSASGLDGLRLDRRRLAVPAGQSRQLVVEASVDRNAIHRPSHDIQWRLEALDADISLVHDSRFLGGTP